MKKFSISSLRSDMNQTIFIGAEIVCRKSPTDQEKSGNGDAFFDYDFGTFSILC